MLDKILDLPALLQAVVGSLLFLIIYEAGKRITNAILKLASKFSHRIKQELSMSDWLHHAHSLLEGTAGIRALVVSIHLAVNPIIHALIFALLGVFAAPFVGQISVMAYLIAIAYLYLALRAVRVDFGPPRPKAFHRAQMARLDKDIFPEAVNEK